MKNTQKKRMMSPDDRAVTAAYRRHGALLSMNPEDAFDLVGRGKGDFDPDGDGETLLGVFVPPGHVDTVERGEPPLLILTGGIEIERGDEDRICGIRRIGIGGLFDAEDS